MLDSDKFDIINLGGAIKHDNYNPVRTEEYGDRWTVYPVDGYGNHDIIRSIVRTEKPDMMLIMTDPRFWTWLWAIENEFRPMMPLVYYHVWDNFPLPMFNKSYYRSNDLILTISKLTDQIVKGVAPEVPSEYLPHSVDTSIFKKYPLEEINKFKKNVSENSKVSQFDDRFTVFWNNRNARRKQSGTLIYWFNDFLNKVGRDKARLIMHTDPKDEHGQDLEAIIANLGLTEGEVMFSRDKLPPQALAMVYNVADVVVNISDAEGFGLATLEALACETPIVVTMTGGLQEQVYDGENWFGVGIKPSSKAIIGSQTVPWIYEDRIAKKDFLNALSRIYRLPKASRAALGKEGRKHVLKNYNFEEFKKKWVETMEEAHQKFGSWNDRKGYAPYELIEMGNKE